MKRLILIGILVLAGVFGYALLNMSKSLADDRTAGADHSRSNVLLSDVKGPHGEYLGRVIDLVNDPDGAPLFAVVLNSDHPMSEYAIVREVPVPYAALIVANQFCILSADQRKLQEAPGFTSSRNLTAEGNDATAIYRYFGLAPFWTNERNDKGADPYRWGGEEQDF